MRLRLATLLLPIIFTAGCGLIPQPEHIGPEESEHKSSEICNYLSDFFVVNFHTKVRTSILPDPTVPERVISSSGGCSFHSDSSVAEDILGFTLVSSTTPEESFPNDSAAIPLLTVKGHPVEITYTDTPGPGFIRLRTRIDEWTGELYIYDVDDKIRRDAAEKLVGMIQRVT